LSGTIGGEVRRARIDQTTTALMQAVFTIVTPVFGLILLGWAAMRIKLLTEQGAEGLTAFVFYVAIPCLLFGSVARGSLAAGDHVRVALAYFAALLIVFAASIAIARAAFGAGLAEAAVFATNVTFGNTVMIGIPLVFFAWGSVGEGPTLAIVGFHSIVLLPLATMLVELGRAERTPLGRTLAVTGVAIARNPVITSLLAGIAWSWLDFGLPAPVERLMAMLAAAAGPCALFALGTSLAGFKIAGDLTQSLAVTILKLVALPVAVAVIGRFVFALDPLSVAIATVVAAMPTGANAFILANKYKLFERRSASAVLISTALSFVTLSVLLAWLAPAAG
jgi:malonate transporter and related proteins